MKNRANKKNEAKLKAYLEKKGVVSTGLCAQVINKIVTKNIDDCAMTKKHFKIIPL